MTNIHSHIFTMDHTPPVQLLYMVKDIILRLLERIPLRIAITRIEQKSRMPMLSLLVPICSPFFQKSVDSMLVFFSSVSDLERSDLAHSEALKGMFTCRGKLTLRTLVRYLRRALRQRVANGKRKDFEQVLVDTVTELYGINNRKPDKHQNQRTVLARLLSSVAAERPYERIVVLSMDFDHAFRHVYNPGFPSRAETGFDYRFPLVPFAPTVSGGGVKSQASELLEVSRAAGAIAAEAGYGSSLRIIPFFCMDPRGYADAAAARRTLVAAREQGYCGVKIYPPLGYLPEDCRLVDVFDYCLSEGLPVMAHCGRGGAGRKGPVNCSDFAHPYNWIPVLDRLAETHHGQTLPFGTFNLCLAHFDSLRGKHEVAWWDEIIRMIRRYHGNEVVNVFVDVSANHLRGCRQARKYFTRLSGRVYHRSPVRDHILFGTDWWMQLYATSEPQYLHSYFTKYAHKSYYPGSAGRQGSAALRALFEENAKRYLGRWY